MQYNALHKLNNPSIIISFYLACKLRNRAQTAEKGAARPPQAMMFAEADAFVTIPGGFGTLDETLEITTWWAHPALSCKRFEGYM